MIFYLNFLALGQFVWLKNGALTKKILQFANRVGDTTFPSRMSIRANRPKYTEYAGELVIFILIMWGNSLYSY